MMAITHAAIARWRFHQKCARTHLILKVTARMNDVLAEKARQSIA